MMIDKIKDHFLNKIFLYRVRWIIFLIFVLIFLIYWMGFNVERAQSEIQCRYILSFLESQTVEMPDMSQECADAYSFKNLLFNF